MFAQIIRDPASSTEEVNISFFYESLQIAFPNNVLLVSKFRGWSLKSARHSTEREGRGQQSSLAFKATWTKKLLAENRSDFDRVKKVLFYSTIEKF